MERCPICRAGWGEGTLCRRCGSDLRWALAVRAEGERLEQDAVRQLRQGQPGEAARLAQRALLLCATPLAMALREFLGDRTLDTTQARQSEAAPENPDEHY